MKKGISYDSMHRVADKIQSSVDTRAHEPQQLSRADIYYIQKNPDKKSPEELAKMYRIDTETISKIRSSEAPAMFR